MASSELIPPKQVIPGRWYYGVDCTNCERRIVLQEDLQEGKGEGMPDGMLSGVGCPHCGETLAYGVGSIMRFIVPE